MFLFADECGSSSECSVGHRTVGQLAWSGPCVCDNENNGFEMSPGDQTWCMNWLCLCVWTTRFCLFGCSALDLGMQTGEDTINNVHNGQTCSLLGLDDSRWEPRFQPKNSEPIFLDMIKSEDLAAAAAAFMCA